MAAGWEGPTHQGAARSGQGPTHQGAARSGQGHICLSGPVRLNLPMLVQVRQIRFIWIFKKKMHSWKLHRLMVWCSMEDLRARHTSMYTGAISLLGRSHGQASDKRISAGLLRELLNIRFNRLVLYYELTLGIITDYW